MILDTLKDLLSDYNINSINEKTVIEKLPNWDSLIHLEFLIKVEEKFGIEITAKEVIRIKTIGDLIKIIEESYNGV